MTKKDLQRWVAKAYGGALPGFIVPWVAAGSPHGHSMGLKWIESPKSLVAGAGWATLSNLVAIKDDKELDLAELKRLLERVQRTIHQVPDMVRYQMNGLVIAVGCYVQPLSALAMQIGKKNGTVTCHLGNNSCQVPFAPDYIRKVQQRGTIGKKRKTV